MVKKLKTVVDMKNPGTLPPRVWEGSEQARTGEEHKVDEAREECRGIRPEEDGV